MRTIEIRDLPDDLEPGMREHIGGQMAIQTIITVLGVPDPKRGKNVISTDEILQSLAMGLGMMVAGDSRNKTPQAIRNDAEKWGKMIAGYARVLSEGDDNTAAQLMGLMHVEQESIAPN